VVGQWYINKRVHEYSSELFHHGNCVVERAQFGRAIDSKDDPRFYVRPSVKADILGLREARAILQ
jgi:hypothetical protein